MKKFILTVLFTGALLSQTKANADWLCVYPDKKVYFQNADSLVYCIRIDSTSNDNTILYPFSDIQKIDCDECNHGDCYSITSGSWLSKYIVLDKNGNTFFVNGKDQRIFIKSQADLHESWEAFSNDDIKINGEVTSVALKPVLGVVDSVKTISFSVLDSNGMPVEDTLNQMTVEVSKNFGLVKTVNFYFFEYEIVDYNYNNQLGEFNLIGISKPQLGFQPIRLRELYFDFQPGDELHISNVLSQIPYYWRKREIIQRYLSRDDYEDSIVYKYESKVRSSIIQYADSLTPDISMTIDALEQTIVKGPLFNTEPNEPFGDFITKVMIINSPSPRTYFWNSSLSWDSYSSCYSSIPDAGGIQGAYLPGLGGPYYEDYGTITGSENSYKLVYYKKGDVESGTPFDFTGIENVKNIDWTIFPNPAKDHITVRFQNNVPSNGSALEIYDINGKKWLSKSLESSGSIDISFLHSGCYIVKLIQKNKTVAYVKMIKE